MGRGRARCGGDGQRHGNLLERADRSTQLLNQNPTPCPACSFNASRRNEETFCTAWNVVTQRDTPQLSFLFCSNQSRSQSQGDLPPAIASSRKDVFDAPAQPPKSSIFPA